MTRLALNVILNLLSNKKTLLELRSNNLLNSYQGCNSKAYMAGK